MLEPSITLARAASWVIVNKATNETVCEIFSEALVNKLNTEKYKAVPILEYLQTLNKQIRGSQ